MDEPDELRRKLRLLEGDKTAYHEHSKSMIEENRRAIVALRKENKQLVAHLRELKNPPKRRHGTGVGEKAVELLDHKVSNQIKRHNKIRSEADGKVIELEKLQQALIDTENQHGYLESHSSGESGDAVRVRVLENDFDKARIRAQEATAIGNTYGMIIKQLLKDRLHFDNEVTDLEKLLRARKQELLKLEQLCTDAINARDTTKAELSAAEHEATEARLARDAEKKKLNQKSEEQRKKYEAMERRLRQGRYESSAAGEGDESRAEAKKKIESYEEAMRRIQDATGVSDIQEVVTRFYAQGESQQYLEEMRVKNTALQEKLHEDFERVNKEFEALKYSGEARNTSNQRMLTEFEDHLTEAETRKLSGESKLKAATQMLVKVKTGIDHLHDKLATLQPVTHRAANTVETKLEESQLRLVNLVEELKQQEFQLTEDDPEAPLVVSEFNTRIPLTETSEKEKVAETDSEDEDVISREQIKKQAQDLVDSKNKKVKRKKKGRF